MTTAVVEVFVVVFLAYLTYLALETLLFVAHIVFTVVTRDKYAHRWEKK